MSGTDIITQDVDVKLVKQVLQALGGDNSKSQVNIITVGNISLGQDREVDVNAKAFLSTPPPGRELLPYPRECSFIPMPDELVDSYKGVLVGLPAPRLANALKLLFEAANRHCSTISAMCRFLDISESAGRHNLKKFEVIR